MSFPRQRFLDAMHFSRPDKIPVFYHPSPAGLYIHGQKLLDLFRQYPPDNPIQFASLPQPPASAFDARGDYHELKIDDWGATWEYLIFGIQGHPKKYPIESWEAAQDYEFPPLSSFLEFDKADVFNRRDVYLFISGWISIFERLHALRPMDELMIGLATEDRHLMQFLDRLVDFWLDVIDALIDTGIDVIFFGDDWGTQSSTLVSPAMFRDIFKPRYQRLIEPIRQANRKFFFHCCGYMGEILDEIIDLGFHGLWPQLVLFEQDPSLFQKCEDARMTLFIHPDRQTLIPRGTPQLIESTIARYAAKYHQLGGGGIFYIEIENDAPFENVAALIQSVFKYR
ncbi:MAG: uroporphyrinogen decarboxylase family protein [Candidatus Zhuqueibacterota bacterium]